MSNRNTGYDFAQKENWRNRVWNQLAKRVEVRPSDATVLYLAAEDDLDFEPARKRGFHSANLIAINSNAKVVDALRAKGRLAIHGDALEVVASWPAHTPIHALHLDYCGGASNRRLNDIALNIYAGQCAGCVFSVNMLRGREPDWRVDAHVYAAAWERARLCISDSSDSPHRGWVALCFLTHHLLTSCEKANGRQLSIEEKRAMAIRWNGRMSPSYFSYPSGGLIMDTVIFNNPIPDVAKNESIEEFGALAMRRQISAVLAHRTRRLAA